MPESAVPESAVPESVLPDRAAMITALDEIYTNANRLISSITDDQWSLPTPCTEWDTRALVNHMAGTTKFFAASATRSAPEGGDDPDHLGDAPAANFAAAAEATMAAWRGDGALDGEVSLPGEMPAVVALGINILDIGTHTWDLATAVGGDAGLTAAHVALIDHWNRQVVTEEVRAGGGFGEILEPEGESELSGMLAYVGRAG